MELCGYITVSVHLLLTQELHDIFPEKHFRRARWVPVSTAMRETGLLELRKMFARLLRADEDILPWR